MATARNVSTLEFEFAGLMEYEWTFNLRPRSVLLGNFDLGPWPSSLNKKYEFKNMRFTTGDLSKLDHYWELEILPNFVIHVQIWVKKRDDVVFKIHSSRFSLGWKGRFEAWRPLEMTRVSDSTKKDYYMAESSRFNPFALDSYDESVDAMQLVLRFQCESSPKYIHPLQSYSSFAATAQRLNLKEYFMNRDLSDVTLICGDEKFYSHRLVLASRSPVFKVMFATEMKESKERIVEIKDVQPKVLKELLHFMYMDDLNSNDIGMESMEYCLELFKLTERYDVRPLKVKCAQEILKNMSVENAIQVYSLGDTYNDDMLKVAAIDLIKRDRVKAMQNPQEFKEFTLLYPDIAFELLKP